MKIHRALCALLVCMAALTVHAQPPGVQWTCMYTGLNYPVPYEVVPTQDGGYAAAGTASNLTPFLTKVDSAGTFLWTNSTFMTGPSRGKGVRDFIEDVDGTFVLVGTNYYNPWEVRRWIAARVSATGTAVWSTIIVSAFAQGDPRSISRCQDSTFIIGGEWWASALRMSADGMNLYERTYEGDLRAIYENPDGTFIGAGTSWYGANAPDFYLVHTNALGVMNWQRTYNLINGQTCYAMDRCPDGGFLLAGYDSIGAWGNDWDMLLMKVNAAGDTQWTQHYQWGSDERALDVHCTADGGAIVLADVTAGGQKLVRVDSVGATLWTLSVSGYALSVTPDGGYILAGVDATHLILTKYAPDPALALPPPANLTVGLVGPNVVLQWLPVPGAAGYQVYSAADAGGPFNPDLNGTYEGTTWSAPLSALRGFYYVTAHN